MSTDNPRRPRSATAADYARDLWPIEVEPPDDRAELARIGRIAAGVDHVDQACGPNGLSAVLLAALTRRIVYGALLNYSEVWPTPRFPASAKPSLVVVPDLADAAAGPAAWACLPGLLAWANAVSILTVAPTPQWLPKRDGELVVKATVECGRLVAVTTEDRYFYAWMTAFAGLPRLVVDEDGNPEWVNPVQGALN